MTRLRVTAALSLLFISFLPFTLFCTKAQSQEPVRIYAVNPLTGDSFFNVTDLPVNTVFTVGFYVGNVTDLVAWQIDLSYNNSLIHYAKAWLPYDNVFKEAIDKGATPLKEVANNVDNATNTGNLLIFVSGTYTPGSNVQYPVNVTSRALMCKVNFTVASHPAITQLSLISTRNPDFYISPPYFFEDYATSVRTLDGTYAAGGDPAVIQDVDLVPEFPLLIFLLAALQATLILILSKRKREQRALASSLNNKANFKPKG